MNEHSDWIKWFTSNTNKSSDGTQFLYRGKYASEEYWKEYYETMVLTGEELKRDNLFAKWFEENCKPTALDSGLFFYEGGFWPRSFLKGFWEENIYAIANSK